MPNLKSAVKHLKTSRRRRDKNKAANNRIANTRRKLYSAITSGDKTKCQGIFRTYCSLLDKAVKKQLMKANTVNRRKSRAAARLAAI